jgi:hypothetical protein
MWDISQPCIFLSVRRLELLSDALSAIHCGRCWASVSCKDLFFFGSRVDPVTLESPVIGDMPPCSYVGARDLFTVRSGGLYAPIAPGGQGPGLAFERPSVSPARPFGNVYSSELITTVPHFLRTTGVGQNHFPSSWNGHVAPRAPLT